MAMSIEGLVLQYCSPHNIHNTKINSIKHNQVTLKINYTSNDFVKITNNNMTGFKNEPNTNNWATQGSISKSLLGNISQFFVMSNHFLKFPGFIFCYFCFSQKW